MIQRTFLWLSGANLRVLDRCPSEMTKQVSIGAAVASTAVLAGLAAAVVLGSFVGLPWSAAVPAGVLWALVIGNLDRFLVASSRRQPSRLATFVQFLPRLALAVLVGTVIAEPLVLKIFDTEITQEATQARQRTAADRRRALDDEYAQLTAAQQERDRISQGLDDPGTGALQSDTRYQQALTDLHRIEDDLRGAEDAVICEKEGTCGSGKVGAGPAYQEKLDRRERLRGERDAQAARVAALERDITAKTATESNQRRAAATTRLTALDADIERLRSAKQQAEADFAAINAQPLGLLDRMEAAASLAASNPTINAQQWVLRLFIMAIDSLPVLVKMLQSFGRPSLYDEQLDLYEAEQLADARATADATETAGQLRAAAAETVARLDAERDVADAEAEAAVDRQLARYKAERARATKEHLIDRYLAVWEADQRARLDADLATRFPGTAAPAARQPSP